jgi:ribosome-binding protein aMBF1 (putative translation factor)
MAKSKKVNIKLTKKLNPVIAARRASGFTRKQIAAKMNITVPLVKEYENTGAELMLSTFLKFLTACDLQLVVKFPGDKKSTPWPPLKP